MKKLLFTLLGLLVFHFANAQTPATLPLLGHWDDDSLPLGSPGNLRVQYNSCWGLAVNGHEIAVVGGSRHVLFFDVTDASAPELIGKFEGTATTVPREFKSYKNRIYGVSDGTTEGLMIFDLTNAPDSIVLTYWESTFCLKSHTIALDTVSGRIYLNGSDAANSGIRVLDASQNPDQPVLLATALNIPGGYVHDCYVRGDTVYASSGNEGYYVFDFKTNPQAPKLLAQVSTGGYNHNSWLTLDGRYAYYTEEIPRGRPVEIVDLQNLANGEIELAGSFLHSMLPAPAPAEAIPHNLYIRDNWLFVSQYEDGLLVYDISDPLHPVFRFWYDTHPENTSYNGYFGCWGNYPWLPSGHVIASDMQNGLFVFENPDNLTRTELPDSQLDVQVFPNPANDFLNIRTPGRTYWHFRIFTATGQIVRAGENQGSENLALTIGDLSSGVYFLEILDKTGRLSVGRFFKG